MRINDYLVGPIRKFSILNNYFQLNLNQTFLFSHLLPFNHLMTLWLPQSYSF